MARYIVSAGWQHAPHLDEGEMEAIIASTPPHLVDARSRGIPTLGSGSVYPVLEKDFVVDSLKLKDTWRRGYGMDVGWHATAALWFAHDTDADVVYIYDAYKQGKKEPQLHAANISMRDPKQPPLKLRGVIDPSSWQGDKKDGMKLIKLYRDAGLDLVPAENEVEAGIAAVWNRLSSGRIKVIWNSNTEELLKEYRKYRRDDNGRIVKKDDHLMDCFSDDTEVLTKDGGWKLFKDLKINDLVGTVNLETDALEFQEPISFVEKDWNGPLILFDNKSQQKVTPSHRMVVYPRRDAKNSAMPLIKAASEVSIWDRIKMTASKWEGENIKSPWEGCDYGDYAEVLGWWIAEGSLNHPYECNPYRKGVVISQLKEYRLEELDKLLSKTPAAWNYVGSGFQCTNKALYDLLKPLGNSYTKYVPDYIKNSPQHIIARFLKGYFAGDGWDNKAGGYNCATVSKRLADDIQELLFKLGIASSQYTKTAVPYFIGGRYGENTKEQYWVVSHSTDSAYLRNSRNEPNFHEVDYEGKVYCVEVPNGTLVVRRNGRVSVSGNCLRYLIMSGLRHGRAPAFTRTTGPRIQGAKYYGV